jgi:predicted SprT family Zn-dependent metalloprotease
VSFEKDLATKDGNGAWGITNNITATIRLDKELLEPARLEFLMQTWEHELMHALMDAHGVLNHDETFVDGMASMRRQFEVTKAGSVLPDKKKAPRGRPKKR